MQKIVPHLWFDKEAKEAAEFYVSAFGNGSKITHVSTLHDTPSGDCDIVSFDLCGFSFMTISAGPLFTLNPCISFMLNFDPLQDRQARKNLDALWEPHLEGRNIGATFFEIYFNDPFLMYVYTASIAFFVALYKAFMLLGYIGQNKTFSLDAVRALRTIKYCTLIIIAFIAGAEVYIFIAIRGTDDITGGVAMGLFTTFFSLIIAVAAGVFEGLLQNAVDMKSNNDLTA